MGSKKREITFNTKKVRLKLDQHAPQRAAGSAFNTKKVRLKPRPRCRFRGAIAPFNTKKVRLKQHKIPVYLPERVPFNTKKVRLKPDLEAIRQALEDFQYQKGAIKTKQDSILSLSPTELSIPKRCD